MKRKPEHNSRTLVAAALLALAAPGCAMSFDATSLGVPATMASAASQPAVGDTFDVATHAVYLMWGLIPAKTPSLENTLEGQIAGARAVQDLRIRVSRRWPDLLVTALTAGLVAPVTVHFQGVAVPRSQ